LQIDIINNEFRNSKKGVLHGKPLIDDPMESIVEAHVYMLEWHMQSRKFGMTADQLELLQQKSIEVLESFKTTFPEKTVLPMAGNSKRSIVFYTRCVSWFSLAGQRISALKALSTVTSTNNKEVFLTILRHLVREGHIQYLNQLHSDLYAEIMMRQMMLSIHTIV
jgi:hypothetical protein